MQSMPWYLEVVGCKVPPLVCLRIQYITLLHFIDPPCRKQEEEAVMLNLFGPSKVCLPLSVPMAFPGSSTF